MKYRESQAEYYGKKRMNLLVIMLIRWIICDNESGVDYSFHDYIVKGYTSQDQVQVRAIIQLVSRIINDNTRYINNIII